MKNRNKTPLIPFAAIIFMLGMGVAWCKDNRELTHGWQAHADHLEDYYMEASGEASGYIKSAVPEPRGHAWMEKWREASPYHNQRIRMTGIITVKDIDAWVSLYVRVHDHDERMLSFYDDIKYGPVRGSKERQKFNVVFAIPENSALHYYGISMEGRGEVRLHDVYFETVGEQVPVSPMGRGRRFGWQTLGDFPEDYYINAMSETNGYIKSSVSEPRGRGTLAKTLDLQNYLGKRVRLTASVKTLDVEEEVTLYMRVDDPDNKILMIDNMRDRPIKGTTDWQRFEIVLDIPQQSSRVSYGMSLYGRGEAWIDRVQFEVVGDNVPTTNMRQEKPDILKWIKNYRVFIIIGAAIIILYIKFKKEWG